jgi:hypothetical protein
MASNQVLHAAVADPGNLWSSIGLASSAGDGDYLRMLGNTGVSYVAPKAGSMSYSAGSLTNSHIRQ